MDLKDKKILVTGGAGFLGSRIVEKLIERGVAREYISVPRSRDFDLRSAEACARAVLGQDIVIHAAATTGGIVFHEEHPAKVFYDNLMMGVELMEASRKAGVEKFVTIGSATEYPENAPIPYAEENLWLGITEPIHIPYTIAKKMLLVQGTAYRAQYGFNAIHLLLTNMYGPGEKLEREYVIPSVIKRIWKAMQEGKEVIEVWGTGRPTRDFLYVDDAAEAVVLALEKYDKPEPVNIGSGFEVSIAELAHMIAEIMGFTGKIFWNTEKPDGQMRRVLDTRRAEREFGFRARTDFKTGLTATVEWYQQEIERSNIKN